MEGVFMRRLLLVPACLIGFACQSSQYVTREELQSMIALPPAEQGADAKIQRCDLDALVAGAFTAPEAATRAAAALAATDQKMTPLTRALSAIDQSFSVCANNLANAETTAYKRTRAVSTPEGTPTFRLDFEQGALENTGRQLDLGIQGQGLFKVKTTNGYAYTRNGNFFINKEGRVVLGMGDGYKLEPQIEIPKGTTDVSISIDGKVTVMKAGMVAATSVGQIELHQFINPQGLKLLGGSLYLETEASGHPTASKPGEDGAGQALQGFLEGSNVDPMKERLRMRFLQNWRATILNVINETK
jgi:flagellar basal-body rod protein FlgG